MTLTDKIKAAVTVARSTKYPDSHAVWIEGVEVVAFRVEARAQEEAMIERGRIALAVRLAREPVEEAAPVPAMTREQAIEACALAGRSMLPILSKHPDEPVGAATRDYVARVITNGYGDSDEPGYDDAVLAKSREPAIAAALAQTDQRKGNVDGVAAAVADARRQAFEEAIGGAYACGYRDHDSIVVWLRKRIEEAK